MSHEGAINPRHPVFVVGAGPVGLATACFLEKHGVPVRIVDLKKGPSIRSKAIALHSRTLEVLESLGVVDSLRERGQIIKGICLYYNGKLQLEIPFDDLGDSHKAYQTMYPYILTVEQSKLEEVLLRKLEDWSIDVEWNTKVVSVDQNENEVFVAMQKSSGDLEVATCPYLLACDGSGSTVRRHLNIPFPGFKYSTQLMLADIEMTPPVEFQAQKMDIFMNQKGDIAIVIPFGSGGKRRIICNVKERKNDSKSDQASSTSGENMTSQFLHQEEGPSALFDEFLDVLGTRLPYNIDRFYPIWVSKFRIYMKMMNTFQVGRFLFLGDAAHVHSPVGGQGMNLGIQDADNLVWKLGYHISRDSKPNLLKTYNFERSKIAKNVLKWTDRFTRMAFDQSLFGQTRRNLATLMLGFLKPLRAQLVLGLSQLNHSYGDSSRDILSVPLVVGMRAPDAPVSIFRPESRIRRVEQPHRLLQIFRSTSKFTLLLFEGVMGWSTKCESLQGLSGLCHTMFPWLVSAIWIIHPVNADKWREVFDFLPDSPHPLLNFERLEQREMVRLQASQLAANKVNFVALDILGQAYKRYLGDQNSVCLVRPDGYIAFKAPHTRAHETFQELRRMFFL